MPQTKTKSKKAFKETNNPEAAETKSSNSKGKQK
jgi:hypothetical protein